MIRRAETDADRSAFARIWSGITPREPLTADEVRRRLDRYPERLYLLAAREGEAVGCGSAGWADSPGRVFVSVRVLPDWRRRGVGSELFAACESHGRTLGGEWISGLVGEEDRESRAWAERRGFVEFARHVELVRKLAGDEAVPQPPAGIEVVELTLDLRESAYAVAVEAWPDLATPEPIQAPPYERWLEEDLGGPVAFAALERGRVVAYAALCAREGDPGLLEHGFTAVLRGYRGREIGTALKRAQIAWAAARGYRELVTFTQEGNVAMRAVNEKLGYGAQPGWISLRRPLV